MERIGPVLFTGRAEARERRSSLWTGEKEIVREQTKKAKKKLRSAEIESYLFSPLTLSRAKEAAFFRPPCFSILAYCFKPCTRPRQSGKAGATSAEGSREGRDAIDSFKERASFPPLLDLSSGSEPSPPPQKRCRAARSPRQTARRSRPCSSTSTTRCIGSRRSRST